MAAPVLLPLLLCCSLFARTAWGWEGQLLHQALKRLNGEWLAAREWKLPLQKGVMKGQTLDVVRHWNHSDPWHSCYTVTCRGNQCPSPQDGVANVVDFCYPAIIITGFPKCGTSAMYDLLSRYSGAVKMAEKENCPYTRRRGHWEYFQSLPRMKYVSPGKLVIDACLDTPKNLLMREVVLRRPRTLYVVMVRNFADMLWSSYNFWCKREYDGFACDNTRWIKAGMVRSPELFHDMVLRDRNGTLKPNDSPLHKGPPDMTRPCNNAGGYYSEFLQQLLLSSVPLNQTLVLASEQLETEPLVVWARVSHRLKQLTGMSAEEGGATGLNVYSFALGSFLTRRYNPQNAKGGSNSVPMSNYTPGVFRTSGFRPMLNATRALLDKCWFVDCQTITELTGHFSAAYPCRPEAAEGERARPRRR